MPYYVWMITWMKNVNNFQKAKVQPQGVLFSICLIFCQAQPGVAYKSVTYKKRVYVFMRNLIANVLITFISHLIQIQNHTKS